MLNIIIFSEGIIAFVIFFVNNMSNVNIATIISNENDEGRKHTHTHTIQKGYLYLPSDKLFPLTFPFLFRAGG